jgi:small subunit ribosomal protein S19e
VFLNKMATIYDIEPGKLIERASKQLKEQKIVEMPEWAKFVKTSHGKERPPMDDDWWYGRVASILRKIYILGPIGVSKLSRKYGCKKDRGHKPEKTVRGSTKIIRTILQQLDKAGMIISAEKGVHKGKIITPKGKSFLDKLSK